MERNREARRVSMAAANGLTSRRRHRTGSLRDSPEDDGPVELQETARLRDRGTGKKDRDRDRERDRDRDRDRERERERDRDRDRDRMSSRGKRRRGDRLISSNREDGVVGNDDSSEESVNDDDEDGGAGVGTSMRMLPPNPSSLSSSSLSNHLHRKSFPPPTKVFRTAATAAATTVPAPWKAPDEMIGVSVPRKARSASTKRSHEWASSCGVGIGEQLHRQASTSPARSSGGAPPALASASASPAPVSPSSSNASVKKKMKPNGPKQRPPKSSPKFNTTTTSTSSNQEEIEIEIAEVLYGLTRQPQGPSKQDTVIASNDLVKYDTRDVASNHNNNNNKYITTVDAKSRVSSPISNSFSPSIVPSSSSAPTTNNSTSSAIAPKRKRPRPVKYDEENPSVYPARNSPITSAIKADTDQPAKIESCSPNLEKKSGSVAENGVVSSHDTRFDQAAAAESNEQPKTEQVKSENNQFSDSKPVMQESESKRDSVVSKEEPRSPKKESSPPAIDGLRLDDDRERITAAKLNSTVSETEIQQEDKFQIDLMAPPPSRSSPERDSEIDSVDPKPVVTNVEMERKPAVKKDGGKAVKVVKDVNIEQEEKKAKITAEEIESQKLNVNSIKERKIDLQLDLEKSDRDSGTVIGSGNKVNHHVQKQHQQQPSSEKAAQTNSLPLPMSLASWPGGLPHMGYMAPLQGVVSMDGSTVPSAAIRPPHLLFNQPRPKRCATHCYIARNIHCHQQFTRMNPFWPAAAGSALQFGAKPCNVNVVPSTDLHAGRAVSSVQDKGLAIFPGHTVKEKSSQAANIADAAQRKQIFLQQPLPPGAPSNILHGPAFIFPLNQQQAAAAAASVRPGTIKSSSVPGSAASSSTSSSVSMSAAASAVAGATAMSFNYPNMPGNEAQYLAILQNSAYPIPIPAHVGSAPTYRGTPPQALPFFNGSFYSSQIIHPQQLQQQQPPASQSQQGQQVPQNPSMSSGSSSSHKHLQNQQLRQPSGSINGGSASLQGFPTSKTQQSQTLQLQPRQQMQNQHVPHQARQLENELGEDSPSTADSRVSRTNISIYGQNYTMPIHPPNFTLMTSPTIGGATTASGNPGEKKQQQSQPQVSKVVEPSQAFAMSFASINGPTPAPSLDASSIAQNHAILQSLPDSARQGYHFMAAAVAQAAQQKKNYRVSEEGKTGGNDCLNAEDDRKTMPGGKVHITAGQSIAFSRPDLTDSSVLTMQGNALIDSSGRTLNLGAASARATGSVMSASISSVNASSAQQQQIIQLQKQQQFAVAAAASARNKTSATSNGSVYPEHVSTSSIAAAKFPNVLSGFPSNLVQSSSPSQSPQWKNSVRTSTSQAPSPSLSSTSTSIKNLPHQQGRMQQGHTQISFAANSKPSATPQGQPVSNGNQSPSPPMVVNSPTTSSISKSAGGSPRTTSNSTSNKGGQSSTLSSQQAKNSPSAPPQKSSATGRNISSMIGHPLNSIPSSSSSTKSQLPQQQLLPKHALTQAQMLYSNSYIQAQAQHAASSTHTTSGASGFYLQRHRNEQQQPPQCSSAMSSAGMMMCPVSLPNSTTTDPAKVAAAAANSMKGGGLSQQGFIHAQIAAAQSPNKAHLVPAGFPYVHAVPTAVQVKPAEQKQPAAD